MWIVSQDNRSWINLDTGRKITIKENKDNMHITEVNGTKASVYFYIEFQVIIDDTVIGTFEHLPAAQDFVKNTLSKHYDVKGSLF